MKILLMSLITFSSFNISASDVKCNISSLRDAQNCMDTVASNHVEYNLPNIGSASSQKKLLKKVLQATGRNNPKDFQTIDSSDYVGVMLEKGDEWYLYYYTLKKGKSQSVVEIESLNLVDITDELITPITVSDLILGDRVKRFDTEDRGWIQDYLDLE